MYDIITIGSATQDVFLMSTDYALIPSKQFSTGMGECFAFGSKIEVKNIFLDTGGGATNTAVTFVHLGLKTACLARVGNDAPAREIRDVLQKEKAQTSLIVTTTKEHTAYSTILITNTGERTVLVYRGASGHFSSQEIPWKKLKARWLYISSLGGNMPVLKRIFAHAKKNDIAIAWNPGAQELQYGKHALQSFIDGSRVFIVNREEGARLLQKPDFQVQEILKGLSAHAEHIIALTDASHGAYVYEHGQQWYAPSSGHKAVNATGAGDAFGSAFVAGIAKQFSIVDALRLAILNSGLVVTKMGAKNGLLPRMPSLSVLRKLTVKKFS